MVINVSCSPNTQIYNQNIVDSDNTSSLLQLKIKCKIKALITASKTVSESTLLIWGLFLTIAFFMIWWVGHHWSHVDNSLGIYIFLSIKQYWVIFQLTSVSFSVLALRVISYTPPSGCLLMFPEFWQIWGKLYFHTLHLGHRITCKKI